VRARRIRDALASVLGEVDAVTYATEALRTLPGIDFDGPMLRIPHPRRGARALREKPRSDRIHLGFLGTVRQHKGLADIEELVLRDPRHCLHVFRGALPQEARRRLAEQLVEHDADAPMEDVYAEIDVVVLPQDRSPGARSQLPAKLLDAMRFGKPIVASSSAPIVEAAADTVLYVADWGSIDEVRRTISRAHTEGSALGLRARLRFQERLALEAQVIALRELIQALSGRRDDAHHPVGAD
jgi:glycosyltransferase involved in cell wall biosynthesis